MGTDDDSDGDTAADSKRREPATGAQSDRGEPRLAHATVRSTASVERNVWMHIAATFDSSNGQLAIYFNGALQNAYVAAPPGVMVGKRGTPLLVARSSMSEEGRNFFGIVAES
jgi:hypothetical protein